MMSKRKRLSENTSSKSVVKKQRVAAGKQLFSPQSFGEDILLAITAAYREKTDYKNEKFEYSTRPYPHWRVRDFVTDIDLPRKLKEDLMALDFKKKTNDLYKFSQSKDIQSESTRSISVFRDALFNDFRTWLEHVLDTNLADTIDMSCAQYNYTDYLLCHDDKVDDRQIAFIYYIVPEDWSYEDGGRLDLFTTNEDGHPGEIGKSLIPEFNSLVFFEVSNTSYHQVSEVLTQSKSRLSISGWFHSVTDPCFQHLPFQEDVIRMEPLETEEEILLEWISPQYLHIEVANDIQREFEENSEIQLPDFLKPEMYRRLLEELRSNKLKWRRRGPPNKRFFWSMDMENGDKSDIISKFLTMVRSLAFFKLLTVFTDLELAILNDEVEKPSGGADKEQTPTETNTGNKNPVGATKKENDEKSDHTKMLTESSISENVDIVEKQNDRVYNNNKFSVSPSCVIEMRRWEHGCFTILDDDQFGKESCLDCVLNMGCEDWEFPSDRGHISYVAGDETEELVTIYPTANSLSLVYRDDKTTRFTRYFDDALASDKKMYDVDLVYYEGKKSDGTS